MYLFNTFFNSPWCFCLLVPLALVMVLAKKPRSFVLLTVHPQLLKGLKKRVPWRAGLHKMFFVAAWTCIIIGLAQPQEISHHEQLKFKTRYVGLVWDKSGSMSEGVTADDQSYANEQSAKDAKKQNMILQPGASLTANVWSKADVTSIAIKTMLPLLKGDEVFLTAFDDKIHWLGVPTTDMEELAQPIHVHINPDGSTNFAGLGEGIDGQPVGGIEGGIKGLKALSKLEDTRILIIITDGDDDIPDKEPGKEFSTLVKHLKEENIHFYVIGVGTSWVQKDWENKLDLAKLAFAVNGKINPHIIRIGKKEEMVAGLTSIASFEAHQSEMETWEVHTNLYPYWVLGGILLLTLSFAVKNWSGEEI